MEIVAPFLTYAAALAVAIPGPGIAALVGQSLGMGFRASLPFIAGVCIGDLVYLTAAVAGLAALAQTFSGALLLIKVLGALYLVYLAYRFWTSQSGLTRVSADRTGGRGHAFLTGFFVTLGNPKAIVFYLALLPAVLNLERIGLTQWAVLGLITITVLFGVLAPYAALASNARHFMARADALSLLNKAAAVTIGSAGLIILGQAIVAITA